MIIKGNRELKNHYHELCSGDIFTGTISSRHMKSFMLIDLLERNINCLPSPLSQILNSSKAAQALILKDWMLPHTYVITKRTELIATINTYNKNSIGSVVTKEEHMHCGYGVKKWDSIETLYSFISQSESSYPFVVQPFIENFTDIRVITVGDYTEAYTRYNPDNFRMNIAAGGKSQPYMLKKEEKDFCYDILKRSRFPFAHIDLMITQNGSHYLTEIALNGGIKGANISRKELDMKKQDLLERLAEKLAQN
jgi:glutathione synthase/RimK-type ligase-like ATP-grasp enzyme